MPGQSLGRTHSTQTPRTRSHTAPRAEQSRSEVQAVPLESDAVTRSGASSVTRSRERMSPGVAASELEGLPTSPRAVHAASVTNARVTTQKREGRWGIARF